MQRAGVIFLWSRIAALGVMLVNVCCADCFGQEKSSRIPSTTSGQFEISDVQLGFAGKYKVGVWTPLTVTLRGGATDATGQLEVELLDGDDQWCVYRSDPAQPVVVARETEATAALMVRFGRLNSQLRARFVADGRTLAERTFSSDGAGSDMIPTALATHEELWVNVGASVGLEAGAKFLQRTQINRHVQIASLPDVARLPTRWYGYEGVSAVVVSTSQMQAWNDWTPQSASLAALREWVERGGRLLVCAGERIEEVFAAGSVFEPFRPAQLDGVAPLRSYGALEQYVESSARLTVAAGSDLRVARLTQVRGVVEARDTDLPLVVRMPLGFGQVVFVPLDLDRSPFTQWPSQGEFLAKLLGQTTARGDTAAAVASQQVNWLGITDLAGQLRGALDQFPGIRLIPFWLVSLLVLAYVALIGPLDYLLVHKLLKRPELTWISFPLIVLATCAGAYALAWQMKGDQLRVNQVDLVDCDVASGLTRGTTWLNVFSPAARTYDVQVTPVTAAGEPVAAAETLLSWFGLPGTAMGGLDRTATGPAFSRRSYESSAELGALRGVPIQIWSSKCLAARWTHREPLALETQLSADFEQVPRGKITNRSGVTLTDGLLAYGRWAINLTQPLAPGDTIELEAGALELDRTELATRLTNRRMVYDDVKKQFVASAEAYDVQGFSSAEILRQMMFYQAVDGQQYTRLANKHQQYVDLSGQLAAGRAILIANGPPGAAQVNIDGQISEQTSTGPAHRHETHYRFVIPVAPYQAKKRD